MASAGTLSIYLLANATGVQQGLNTASQAVNAFQAKIQNVSSSISSQLMAALGVGGIAGGATWGLKLAASAETAQKQFTVLAESADRAKEILADLRQFSQSSPLPESQLRSTAGMLLQYGDAASEVTKHIRQLGDVSMGNADRMSQLALAFGQVASAGHLTGEELRQMRQVWNPVNAIMEKTGETFTQVKARMEAGGVSFREVADALEAVTSAGGRFHGLLKEGMAGTEGAWRKFAATVENLARSLGEMASPAASKFLGDARLLLKALGELDATTISNAARITGLFAAMAGGIYIFAKMVTAIRAVVTALRAMATASAIAQALSGPSGWATLAISLGVAAGAALAVNKAFDAIETQRAKEGVVALDEATKQYDKSVSEINEKAGLPFRRAAKDFEDFKKLVDEHPVRPDKFTPGMETPDADEHGLVDKARDKALAAFEALIRKGEQVRHAMRTPAEELAETAVELQQLFAGGAISAETLARALGAAEKKAADAKGHLKEIDAMRHGVSAAVVGTKEGFSAIQESIRERRAMDALELEKASAAKRLEDRIKESKAMGATPQERLDKAVEEQTKEQRLTTQAVRDMSDKLSELLGERNKETVIEFEVAEF